jgi:hypothetical protein
VKVWDGQPGASVPYLFDPNEWVVTLTDLSTHLTPLQDRELLDLHGTRSHHVTEKPG